MFSGALLFDLDGTLTDSDPFHFAAYAEIGKRYGVAIDERCFLEHISGRLNEFICRDLFPHVDPADYQAIADDKEALFRRLMVGRLKPIAGLPAVLDWGRRHGCGVALVSNAPRQNIVDMLNELGLSERFHQVVVAGELARGKPDPLPYQTALDRLGVPADRAVAFEDTVTGVQSASRAGVATIALTTTTAADALAAAGASLIIGDYQAPELMDFIAKALPV